MDDKPTATKAGSHRVQRGRVLVVDDDQDLCCFLSERLEAAGYQTVLSNNGLEGLRAFEEKRPNLAVIDLNMPVMSGFRLLRLLRAMGNPAQPRVPVIVISGDDPQEAMDVLVETKPDAYLQKPFAAQQLLEMVDDLMARIPSRWPHRELHPIGLAVPVSLGRTQLACRSFQHRRSSTKI